MTYGMKVTPEEADILEEHGIDYTFWDVEALVFGSYGDKLEIVFDDEDAFDKARDILGRRNA